MLGGRRWHVWELLAVRHWRKGTPSVQRATEVDTITPRYGLILFIISLQSAPRDSPGWRPRRGHGKARLDPDHPSEGAARRDVWLCDRLALPHAGPGLLHHALPALRAGARRCCGRNRGSSSGAIRCKVGSPL